MRSKILIAVLLVLAVVFLPVLYKQLTAPDGRRLSGPELDHGRYREVAFRNEDAGIDLAGMLFRPAGPGPFPAVAVIHGSGPSRRLPESARFAG